MYIYVLIFIDISIDTSTYSVLLVYICICICIVIYIIQYYIIIDDTILCSGAWQVSRMSDDVSCIARRVSFFLCVAPMWLHTRVGPAAS